MARCPNVPHWGFFTLNNLAVIQPAALRSRADRGETIEFKKLVNMTEELINFKLNMGKPNDAGDKEKIFKKNKGGRRKGKPKYGNFKLNIYLSEEQFGVFKDFIAEAWHGKNSSGAGRYLLMRTLHEWGKKGRRRV